MRSEGELSGEFDADQIELGGSVKDNTVIRARSLEVKLSTSRGKLQIIFGECEQETEQVVEHSDAGAPSDEVRRESAPGKKRAPDSGDERDDAAEVKQQVARGRLSELERRHRRPCGRRATQQRRFIAAPVAAASRCMTEALSKDAMNDGQALARDRAGRATAVELSTYSRNACAAARF